MSYYDNFKQLSHLNISYKASAASVATIYGNGLNQVEILIAVQLLDTNGKPVMMTQQEMIDSIYLCDYNTGEKLPSDNTGATWNYTTEPGKYVGALEYAPVGKDSHHFTQDENYNYLTLYLYSMARSDGQIVAAGIDIPTIGKFNTTANGTLTPNGPNGSGSVFKMPDNVTAKALLPYQYKTDDFYLTSDSTDKPALNNGGAILYNVKWYNFYLNFRNPELKISFVFSPTIMAGDRVSSQYKGWWIAQMFDFAKRYGEGPSDGYVTVQFDKYSFGFHGEINKQAGVCFSLVRGDCTVPTSYNWDNETYVEIYDQYGNKASPVLKQREETIIVTGVRPVSYNTSESMDQYITNGFQNSPGIPDVIIQHITDNEPGMVCGVLTQNGNTLDYMPCVNVSPVPEQGAMIDSNDLQIITNSNVVTHVVCSVPDNLSHNVAEYQKMSDRDGLKYLLIFWPSQQCLNIYPKTQFGYQGRPYIVGVYDCYSLVRDYLLAVKGVAMSDYPREMYYQNSEQNIFETKLPEEGFVKIEGDSLQPGDFLVLDLPATTLKHAAIYSGSGQILHHLPPGQSRQEAYSESWKKRTSSVWRHKQLIDE
ncbi:hypothetical protein IRA26_004299 [Salmonella enterica]|nr:hypothetical protein [Salmonella enterica subsp. arizonae serovar 62:z4,z32:-]EBO3988527.1 hypothetical protein [Salmonella enterica]ECU0526644.1 hypothetical protein [Salmonella enterica]EDZ3861338.1 hypothetical protein [Salmonella enterica]EEA2460147.1 hypothetical protein [Salmonella enterica]